MIIALSKPKAYRDSELSEIDLDLDSLTGQDLIDIEEAQRLRGRTVQMYSQGYFAAVAARASHLPPEFINSLPLKDFTNITNQVIFFLSDGGSEDSLDATSDA